MLWRPRHGPCTLIAMIATRAVSVLCAALALASLYAQQPKQPAKPFVSKVWVADNGDGTYKNPVLYADYSDPDATRVGDDFYLVASSFDAVPGLPILHSKDLVNWSILTHVYALQPPDEMYRKPQHGNGAWAPSIRFHAGEYYIYYPDPELGIYVTKAKRPEGPWSTPLLIKAAPGWIDPCPLWDDDGKAYLVNALAASRSGIKSTLVVSRMSEDGTKLLDAGTAVYDGHEIDPTIEGPKFYKRNGYYYIFAPAGGVPTGWQTVLRSKNIYGPYERRVVMTQGSTATNGPHQGAWVTTQTGENWFLHFQDEGPYGRVVHLEPMRWVDEWPVIGTDPNSTGTGAPVLRYAKPKVGRSWPIETPADSDEFTSTALGGQWQWQANPQPSWALPFPAAGLLRLYNVAAPTGARNLWETPNVLLQKFPGESFTVTTKLDFHPMTDGDRTGLVVMGMDYATLTLVKQPTGLALTQTVSLHADTGAPEQTNATVPLNAATVYLRVQIAPGAIAHFSYSLTGATFTPIGGEFHAKAGRWIGAKVGLVSTATTRRGEMGYADYDYFQFGK